MAEQVRRQIGWYDDGSGGAAASIVGAVLVFGVQREGGVCVGFDEENVTRNREITEIVSSQCKEQDIQMYLLL